MCIRDRLKTAQKKKKQERIADYYEQIVVVVAEHGELAGRLIVACAVAARLGAGSDETNF